MSRKPVPYKEISESDVKKVTLGFLKHYYRSRPRSPSTLISADMRGMGGIIVDGYLEFSQEDGQVFLATFEATSADKRFEVQFTIRKTLLFWDGLAVSFFLLAIARIWTHELGLYTFNDLGYWLWWTPIFLAAFILAFVYRFVMKPFRRYRYIYAVEQFKQYHADDQWVAIAEDVFPSTEHPYFKELRRQCVKYGFGLLIIDKYLHPHMYMTPAKQDQFKNRREAADFISQKEWVKNLQKNQYLTRFQKYLPWLSRKKKEAEGEKIVHTSYSHHLVMITFCLAVIGSVFYLQWEDRLVERQEQADYIEERTRNMKNNTLEQFSYLVDSNSIWPFEKNIQPYKGNLWEEDLSGTHAPLPSKQKAKENTGRGEIGSYDCSRFFNLSVKKYLVEEGAYPNLELAKQKIAQLSEQGIKANFVWVGCFQTDQEGYIVYLDELYNSLREAALTADMIQDSIARDSTIGLNLSFEIKVLNPTQKENN